MAVVTQETAAPSIPTEGHAPPPDGYTSWDEYTDDFADTYAFIADADARRGMKALRLAPTLEVYRALMAGQRVPREALRPEWVRRYRL